MRGSREVADWSIKCASERWVRACMLRVQFCKIKEKKKRRKNESTKWGAAAVGPRGEEEGVREVFFFFFLITQRFLEEMKPRGVLQSITADCSGNQSRSQQASLQWLHRHCWKVTKTDCLTNRLVRRASLSIHASIRQCYSLFPIYCICSFYYQYSIEQYV